MIRCIAAVDSNLGIADEHGIPWLGKIPSDTAYYRNKIKSGIILMGYATYQQIHEPYYNRVNYVATTSNDSLRDMFEPVHDAREFLTEAQDDVWVLGGAGLFASTVDLADELYLTRIEADFNCTKFFPPFENKFELTWRSENQTENDITFHFEIWKHR